MHIFSIIITRTDTPQSSFTCHSSGAPNLAPKTFMTSSWNSCLASQPRHNETNLLLCEPLLAKITNSFEDREVLMHCTSHPPMEPCDFAELLYPKGWEHSKQAGLQRMPLTMRSGKKLGLLLQC